MARRDDLLSSVLDAVSATGVGPEVLARVLQEVVHSNAWIDGVLWLVDDRRGGLWPVAVHGAPGGESAPRPLAPGDGMAGRAAGTGTAVVGFVTQGEIEVRAFDRDLETGAGGADRVVLAHPIRSGGRVIGVVQVEGAGMDHPAGSIGGWIDGPFENVVPALGNLLERHRDRSAVDAAEGRLAAALEAGEFGVASVDPDAGRAEWSPRMADLHAVTTADSDGPLGSLLQRVDPQDRNELLDAVVGALRATEPIDVHYRVHLDDGSTRWIATQVSATTVPGFGQAASLVSSDITRRRRLEEESRRRTLALEGLQWVSQALLGSQDLDESAQAVVNAATGVLGAEFGCMLYLRPSDEGMEVAWTHSGGDGPAAEPPATVDVLGDISAFDRPTVHDLREAGDLRQRLHELELPVPVARHRSALVAPVAGRTSALLGVVVFLHPEAGYFTEDDRRLAASIASSAGVAVEQAQQHEEARLTSAAFQRALLPGDAPSVESAEICVRYHPGRDGLDVGGDWFDVIPLGPGRVGLAVGDVCGHGIRAAALMGQFRFSFRALVRSASPERAIAELNDIALHEVGTTLTLVYAEVDLRTGEARIWSCGHLPPVLATAPDGDGAATAELLGSDADRGPMLGFVEKPDVTATVAHVPVGHTLLLYTDGLIERRDEGIVDGLGRLCDAFTDLPGDLDGLCDQLYELLAEVGPTADDTAILAFRRV